MLIFIIFSILSYYAFKNSTKNLILDKLKKVQINDCLAFNEEKISKKKYFIRKYFVKHSRDHTYNQLRNFIPINNYFATNNNEDFSKSKIYNFNFFNL